MGRTPFSIPDFLPPSRQNSHPLLLQRRSRVYLAAPAPTFLEQHGRKETVATASCSNASCSGLLKKQNKGLCVSLWSHVDSPMHHVSRRQRRVRPEALPVGMVLTGRWGVGELCFRALGRGCTRLSCWPVQGREDAGCICLVSMYTYCQSQYVQVSLSMW